ncbi:hypothetical protein [Natronorarus salvus]|uniref:hypothetical protein n=1 Tax=Natronorarus salvus TaxID=3117733 RepID=UPI002F26AED4
MRLSRAATIAVVLFLALSIGFSGAVVPAVAGPDPVSSSTSDVGVDVVGQTDGPGPGPGDDDDTEDSNESDDSDGDQGNWVGDDRDPVSGEVEADDTDGDDEEEEDGGGTSISDGLLDGTVDFVSGVIPDVPDVPTPAEATEHIWSYMAVQFHEMFVTLVDEVFNNLLGTPTIHNDGPLGIIGGPEPIGSGEATADDTAADEYDVFASHLYVDLYANVYLPFIMPLTAAILGLAAIGVLIGPSLSAITHHRMLSLLGAAIFAVILVVASWEFAALIHSLSDSATQFFLPDGEELIGEETLADADETAAAGPLSMALGFYLTGGIKALILAIIHGLRHAALFVFPLVLPFLLILAYLGIWQKVKLVGSVLIWQYYALLTMNIPTAILLRIAHEAEWQFVPEGVDFFANLAATMGIFFIAIIIPLLVSGSFLLIGLSMRGVAAGTAMGAAGTVGGRRRGRADGGGGWAVHGQRSFKDRVLGPNRCVARGGAMLAGAGAYYGGRKAVAGARRAGKWAKNRDSGASSRALRGTKRSISAGARRAAARARATGSSKNHSSSGKLGEQP